MLHDFIGSPVEGRLIGSLWNFYRRCGEFMNSLAFTSSCRSTGNCPECSTVFALKPGSVPLLVKEFASGIADFYQSFAAS